MSFARSPSHGFPLFDQKALLKSAILAVVMLLAPKALAMASDPEERAQSSGTGFIVSRQGHILTNHHVVDGCISVRTTTEGKLKELTIVGVDEENDLAVLRLKGPISSVARFREGRSIRPGDSVVVVGYPLHRLLASEANVTTGTVSALAGIGNDARVLQMTAPVQPGNSGGPLLDQSGLIVGIVVSKLNALKMAIVTGDFPQNVNFAINGAVSKLFLDAHNIKYETANPGKKLEPADIGENAKRFTLLLQCYPETMEAELKAELRAFEERRLAEARRVEEEAHKRVIEMVRLELARKAQQEAIEREAAEYQRIAHENELARIASLLEAEAVERARQAKEEEQRQAIKEAEVRRMAQEARAPEYSAFSVAYSALLDGRYDSATVAFQRFVKDYPATTLTANAHYWLGESYYQQKDYVWAMQAFEYVSNEYPANENVPASLFKLGLAAKETGDLVIFKKNLKRVIEEFPSSLEAKLAKNTLADFR